MSATNSSFSRLTNRIFPRMPDFYRLIIEECNLADHAATTLEEYVRTGHHSRTLLIARLDQEGERLRQRNLDILKNAFATPMDRVDLYRAFTSTDCILGYAHAITTEMDELHIATNRSIQQMVELLREAVLTLGTGYRKLATDEVAAADQDAQAVIQACKRIETLFREALANLFTGEQYVEHMQARQEEAEVQAMHYVLDIFKRREIYRHISDAARDMRAASNILHHIVVKVA
ncbi:MAG: hypothetical protein HQM03_16485 [Magnetococcales bacterium]|nr:hypothetical protein [Magnetococcales bacterium]